MPLLVWFYLLFVCLYFKPSDFVLILKVWTHENEVSWLIKEYCLKKCDLIDFKIPINLSYIYLYLSTQMHTHVCMYTHIYLNNKT